MGKKRWVRSDGLGVMGEEWGVGREERGERRERSAA